MLTIVGAEGQAEREVMLEYQRRASLKPRVTGL
jgi:hypothetical protein